MKKREDLNLFDEIVNQRTGSHYIRLDNKEVLEKNLKFLRDNRVFEEYGMTYTMRELEDNILLIIHHSFLKKRY